MKHGRKATYRSMVRPHSWRQFQGGKGSVDFHKPTFFDFAQRSNLRYQGKNPPRSSSLRGKYSSIT